MNVVLSMLFLLIPLSAIAQDKVSESDPFDISSTAEKAEELGIPTISEVDTLEEFARELFNLENCTDAIPVLEEYARKANWLANLISSGLDPYYGASYDDRKNYPFQKIQKLVPFESMSNKYKRKRNIAIAMQGECFAKIGDEKKAVSYLVKALDLINIDNEGWWKRTRENLYNIIELK